MFAAEIFAEFIFAMYNSKISEIRGIYFCDSIISGKICGIYFYDTNISEKLLEIYFCDWLLLDTCIVVELNFVSGICINYYNTILKDIHFWLALIRHLFYLTYCIFRGVNHSRKYTCEMIVLFVNGLFIFQINFWLFLRILTGKKHRQIKLQPLEKVRIWAFGLLVH